MEVWDDPAFPAKVKRLFGSCDLVAAGSLHLIGLLAIRRHFGDRWPKVEDRVHTIIRDVIERRTTGKDVFSRFMDQAYVVLFAELPLEKAQLKCALIAEEIAKRLFGEAGEFKIEVATAEIRPKEEDLRIDKTSADELLRRLIMGSGRVDSTHEVKVPGGRAAPGRSPSFAQRGPGTSSETAALRFVYRPMWLVKKEVISAHMVLPARVGPGGTLLLGGMAMPAPKAGEHNAQLDDMALKTVCRTLAVLEREGRRRPIVLPVHFSTLGHPRDWRRMLDTLRSMSPDQLKQLIIEVIGLHGAEPPFRLLEVIGMIAGMCRAVLVRVRLDHPNLDVFVGHGIYAVGIDLAHIRAPEPQLREQIDRFVEQAEALRLRPFAHGINRISLLSTAVATGFRYLDGDAVATVVEAPTDNRHYTIDDIYGLSLEISGP